MTDPKKDKWLEVFCPEGACMNEEERISLPVTEKAEEHSMWLEIFCPQNCCELIFPTQLP
ncbi:MAG: hypothetical protein P1P89_03655 [Desulfobacterales bacterium]|nr:hypothetical protein [Desulfobacterales bacterium]